MYAFQRLLQDGATALQSGRWKTAISLAMEARQLRPESVQAVMLHANALMEGGLFFEASKVLDRAEEISPDDPNIVSTRGICMFELCKFDSARGIIELSLELDNRMAQAHYYLGLLYERQGDWVEANNCFTTACRLDPESFPVPIIIDDEEFLYLVESAMLQLPVRAVRALDSTEVQVQMLPDVKILTSYAPPLSPQILGIGQCGPGDRLDSIVVFQRNLQRTATDKPGIKEQIRLTIEHELDRHKTKAP